MNYAMLGMNNEALEVAREIIGNDARRLVAVYDAAEFMERIEHIAPGANTAEDWEGLLHAREIDAVVVSGSPGDDWRNDW